MEGVHHFHLYDGSNTQQNEPKSAEFATKIPPPTNLQDSGERKKRKENQKEPKFMIVPYKVVLTRIS